jgi:hypothetical protein
MKHVPERSWNVAWNQELLRRNSEGRFCYMLHGTRCNLLPVAAAMLAGCHSSLATAEEGAIANETCTQTKLESSVESDAYLATFSAFGDAASRSVMDPQGGRGSGV